jgi:hypothetical protein
VRDLAQARTSHVEVEDPTHCDGLGLVDDDAEAGTLDRAPVSLEKISSMSENRPL